jgi:hypothetical protein
MNDVNYVVNVLESQICPALDEVLATQSAVLTPEQYVALDRTLSAIEAVLHELHD